MRDGVCGMAYDQLLTLFRWARPSSLLMQNWQVSNESLRMLQGWPQVQLAVPQRLHGVQEPRLEIDLSSMGILLDGVHLDQMACSRDVMPLEVVVGSCCLS